MKTAFIGTVESSRVALAALIESGQAPAIVVTIPPEHSSRHSDYDDLSPLARSAGCEVCLTTDVNSAPTISALRKVEPELALVIGWSQVCKQEFRDIAKCGSLGFHPAPLPRFRGRAVIPWTILRNEKSSGSTLFWLDEGIDSGPLILQKMFALSPDETAKSLYNQHTANLAEMLPEAVRLVKNGTAPRIVQDALQATYCAKRTPDDGFVNWQESAEDILRLVRAVGSPYPGAFAMWGSERIYIDQAVPFSRPGVFVGLAGQVQCHTNGGFSVLCGDGGLIEVVAWRCKQEGRPRIHGKLLGVNQWFKM